MYKYKAFWPTNMVLNVVLWCADQGSGPADAGGQRQASVSSSGAGALQSAEDQSFTCQVQHSIKCNIWETNMSEMKLYHDSKIKTTV